MIKLPILEGVIALLVLLAIVAFFFQPKQILKSLSAALASVARRALRPLVYALTLPLLVVAIVPMLITGRSNRMLALYDRITTRKRDRAYPARSELKVDFEGEKSITLLDEHVRPEQLIGASLEALEESYQVTAFTIEKRTGGFFILAPGSIGFHDFLVLVRNLCDQLSEQRCYASFRSPKLTFHVYGDPDTGPNLLGVTSDRRKFSIHLLDDFEAKQFLRMNPTLTMEKAWVDQMLR